MNGDLGISFESEAEDEANLYAKNALIPQDKYEAFVFDHRYFDEETIRKFAEEIDRDPGIVVGRLQNDKLLGYTNTDLSNKLRHNYTVVIEGR